MLPSADLSDEELEAIKEEVTIDCLKKSGHVPPPDVKYETPTSYDPFEVHMGQLTVYRHTLRCQCKEELLTVSPASGEWQKCGRFLEYDKQGWPAFMGLAGDSRFNAGARQKGRKTQIPAEDPR